MHYKQAATEMVATACIATATQIDPAHSLVSKCTPPTNTSAPKWHLKQFNSFSMTYGYAQFPKILCLSTGQTPLKSTLLYGKICASHLTHGSLAPTNPHPVQKVCRTV